MKHLVLGGVKSGKSRYAEKIANALSDQVTLIVTAQAQDQEMASRIERHQLDRSDSWRTIESPLRLGNTLKSITSANVIVIDCLTLWLTNVLIHEQGNTLESEVDEFEAAVSDCTIPLIIVSNESNMGVTPLGELSRAYCDQIGLLHQRLANVCDQVDLLVAGLPMRLKG